MARAYHLSLDQVEEMDYLAYQLALKDLAECPIVDRTLIDLFVSRAKKGGVSISDARSHYRRKAR
ncbi:MAG: hypothetical protein AB1403_00735 [Candidatus Riflebacteria bacterium]